MDPENKKEALIIDSQLFTMLFISLMNNLYFATLSDIWQNAGFAPFFKGILSYV